MKNGYLTQNGGENGLAKINQNSEFIQKIDLKMRDKIQKGQKKIGQKSHSKADQKFDFLIKNRLISQN